MTGDELRFVRPHLVELDGMNIHDASYRLGHLSEHDRFILERNGITTGVKPVQVKITPLGWLYIQEVILGEKLRVRVQEFAPERLRVRDLPEGAISEEAGWATVEGFLHRRCGGKVIRHPEYPTVWGCEACSEASTSPFLFSLPADEFAPVG